MIFYKRVYSFPPITTEYKRQHISCVKSRAFAKLKVVSKAEKIMVFLTEHTLLFVIKGAKLLHFGEETRRVERGKIILLRRGIYVMNS